MFENGGASLVLSTWKKSVQAAIRFITYMTSIVVNYFNGCPSARSGLAGDRK